MPISSSHLCLKIITNKSFSLFLFQLEAKDEDSTEITVLQYSIIDGNLNNIYKIDTKTGIISILHASKISQNSSPHRLRAAVSDGRHTSEA